MTARLGGKGGGIMGKPNPQIANAVALAEKKFDLRTRRSREIHQRVQSMIPGGSPNGLFIDYPTPYPVYMDHGDGCWIWDADGNRYFDLVAGDWALPLGHRNPVVSSSIAAQLAKGTTWGGPDAELTFQVATLIQQRIPSMQRMRFTTSATEAVMQCMRLARTHTGRPKIAKMRGAFHGLYDIPLVGNGRYPDAGYAPPGLPDGTVQSTVLLEYNDSKNSVQAIDAEADKLAAVIVEPINATNGMIPATREFLQTLREATQRRGIVLIFDETVTFPVSDHGGQGLYGVTPDLTTLGKVVGGGLPLGVFGGREEIMNLVDPAIHAPNRPPVDHVSTFAGMPICLAASVATMQELTSDAHQHLQDLGEYLRQGVSALAAELQVPLQATGTGLLFGLHWTPNRVVDIQTARTSNRDALYALNRHMYNAGYYMFPKGIGIVSTPMQTADLDQFFAALEGAIVESGLRSV
jgi:glutamate-1-semialdehyde 2,1-aminomutase